jgi:hypothetical protein
MKKARRRQRSEYKTKYLHIAILHVPLDHYAARRLFGVFGAESTDGLSGAPDLEVVNLLELLVVLLTVVGLRVVLERALGLAAVLDGGVEVVEDGLKGILEALAPVDGTTTGSG